MICAFAFCYSWAGLSAWAELHSQENLVNYFGGFLIFAILAFFSVIHKNKFPQIKITTKIFPKKCTPEKIFSNLNSPHKNTVLRNWVCSIKTCLFRSETNWYTRNTDAHRSIAWKYVFHCTYSIKIKILPMLGTGYFLKIQEILVVTSAYAVRPYSLWRGEGKVITCQLCRGWTMFFFLREIVRCICATAFFLAGNRTRNGVAIFVEFKNLFTLQTSFKYFIA